MQISTILDNCNKIPFFNFSARSLFFFMNYIRLRMDFKLSPTPVPMFRSRPLEFLLGFGSPVNNHPGWHGGTAVALRFCTIHGWIKSRNGAKWRSLYRVCVLWMSHIHSDGNNNIELHRWCPPRNQLRSQIVSVIKMKLGAQASL